MTRESERSRSACGHPKQGYEQIMQRNLRDAITNTLPDVAFHGLNRQRTLDERNIPVDLKPFMEADPQTKELGFSPSLLSLGQVGDAQTGIGFSLSTPILYFNGNLVKEAGGDPEKLPTNWDEVIKLSAAMTVQRKIVPACSSTGPLPETGPGKAWCSVMAAAMMNNDESKVTFSEAPGQKAMGVLRTFVDDARMPDIQPDMMFQDFFAGRMGMSMQSTAQLGRYNREIGGPLPACLCALSAVGANGARLPAGGNVAMMFTKDAAKQKAAWEFIKFACGPVGRNDDGATPPGYMPATTIPASARTCWQSFYAQEPESPDLDPPAGRHYRLVCVSRAKRARITDVINDHLQTVVSKKLGPDVVLEKMAADVQSLIPKKG